MTEPDLTSILDAFSSPILVIRPVKDGSRITDFECVHFNESFKSAVHPSISKCRKFSEFKNLLNRDVAWFDLGEKAANGILIAPVVYYSELSHAWFKVQMKGADDGLIVVNLEDITEAKNRDHKLKKIAYHDVLTGLANRNQLNEEYTAFLMKAEFNSTKVGVLILNIDNMKNLNDSKGHKAGDDLILSTARTLERFDKHNVVVYRTGGDEFLVIIQNQQNADQVAQMTTAIADSLFSQFISVSGGVAIYPDDSKNEDELLRYADIAMHTAKKDGKHKIEYFKYDMQRIFIQKMNIQNRMTQAVLESSFTQVYQPQFNVQDGELRGFEALIRWNDAELGQISPSVFIPMAEECGLILPIGTWVLKTAFKTLKNWQDTLNFKGIISVNLSPIQLKQPTIIAEIETLLKTYELDPQTIEIEITEGIMIDNMEDAVAKMRTLKDMGFRISLDDFGTGYSSLSYLQILPLDTLKIDKSFVNDITAQNSVQANITNSIIMMVSKMGLDTIAEGVEEKDQYDLLKKFNCHVIQGFLCGKPMTKERYEAYLKGDKSALLSLQNE